MVVFNPQVQETQAQDFTRDFRPASAPGPNKSGEILMNTVGSAITDATTLADQQIKKDIDSQVYAQVDQQRDAYTQALEAVKGQVKGTPIATGTSDDSGEALSFADNSQPVPPAVAAIEGQVSNLTTARNAGKINDTYYTQQLTALTKNIRAQYPGYREYIDQKVAQVSGMQPANAYYKNLMQDINAGLARSATDAKDVGKLITQNLDLPGAPAMYNAWKANPDIGPAVVAWINQGRAMKYQHDALSQERDINNWGREDTKIKYTDDFGTVADDTVSHMINSIKIMGGMGTVQDMTSKLSNLTIQGIDVNPQELAQYTTAVGAMKQEAVRQLYAQGRKVGANGKTTENIMGTEAFKKMVDDKTRIFDTMIDQVRNKDFGAAFTTANQVQGIKDFGQKELLTNKTAGAYAQTIQAWNGIAPQAVPIITQQLVGSGLSGVTKTYIDDKMKSMILPGASLLDDFRGAKKLSDANGTPVATPRLYKSMLQIPSIIGSSDPRVTDDLKLRAASYAFNPKNQALLDEINMDTTVNGRYVPGKYAAYSVLSAPQMTNNMWKLRNMGGEGEVAWNNYKNWNEVSFARLFRSDIATLQDLSEKAGISIGWDNENGRFTPIASSAVRRPIQGAGMGLTNPADATASDPMASADVNRVINRINGGLASLKEVQKKEGGDTAGYLARILVQSGLNPEGKVSGLPRQILDNMAAARLRAGMQQDDRFFQPAGK